MLSARRGQRKLFVTALTSGGNNFNHFPDNQLTKFCAFYYYTTFQRAKATLIYSFTECMI